MTITASDVVEAVALIFLLYFSFRMLYLTFRSVPQSACTTLYMGDLLDLSIKKLTLVRRVEFLWETFYIPYNGELTVEGNQADGWIFKHPVFKGGKIQMAKNTFSKITRIRAYEKLI